jgi:AraC-like DNA-binding protein
MSADGLGPLSFLFLSAPTLGQAFQTFSKYLDAMQEATYNAFSIEGSVCHFTYAIRDADVTERRQDSEYSIGVMCNLVRQYLGRRSPPQEVHFEHQRLGALSTFENYFDCPVFFEQPQNRLVLPSEWLNRGSSAMSSELFPIIATHLKARMHGETLHTCTATKVRDVLMASPPDDLPALETVAMGLDCSRATLMRKLAREGTHFSELAAERRLDFARQLLRSGTRSIADIALASGYAETASFTRAFKRRFGQLPSHCRRAA